MKKVIISLIAFIGFTASAQVNPQAIGLRFGGDGNINGAEISYQHGLGEANRLELDLGFGTSKHHSRLFLAGIYQWNWNIEGGLNWYAGPGASVGFYSYDNADDHLNIGLGGQVGIEYDFNTKDVPLLLSLDARPMFDFLGDDNGFGWGAALGLRYTF